MPANLTPQYQKAEEEYRQAQTPEERLACLRKMYALMPKHKGTDKLQADVKRKIAEVRKEAEQAKKASKKGFGIRIPREGAGQAVILGPPNAGKSQLLASLTNAKPQVALYPYTTTLPQPGMMPWEDVQVQLIDTPPITADYLEGYMSGMVRAADVALLVADLSSDDCLEAVEAVIERLARAKTLLVPTNDLRGTGVSPVSEGRDAGRSERLQPVPSSVADLSSEGPVETTRTLLIANKCDVADAALREEMLRELFGGRYEIITVSAAEGTGLDALRDRIYRALNVIRVYTKQPGKPPDLTRPFTCPAGSTVLDVAQLVHKEVADNLKFARIWGTGVYDGQTVKRDHALHDRDVLELHT